MARLRISEDFVTISEFKARASQFLRQVEDERRTLVITHNGRPMAVVLPPAEYDLLTERARFIAGVNEGIADADAGRVTPQAEIVAVAEKRLQRAR